MGFSAISTVSSFEADKDSVGAGREKQHKKQNTHTQQQQQKPTVAVLLRHIVAVRYRMKVERGKAYSKADLLKQKWNGPVSCSQHSCFWTFEDRGVRGAGSESLYLYFASTSSM